MASDLTNKPRVDSAEDDLDDLDDVISQFAPTTTNKSGDSSSNAASSSNGPSSSNVATSQPVPPLPTAATRVGPTTRPRHNTRVDAAPPPKDVKVGGLAPAMEEDEIADAFARELSKGMESLMRELVVDKAAEGSETGAVDQDAMNKAWEAMLVEEMNGMMTEPESTGSSGASGSKSTGKNDFQSKIRQTMDKMKEGEQGAGDGPGPDFESLLAELTDGLKGDGGDSEEELAGFIETMMTQLMSKEILHDPLKELSEKLPEYIKENATKLPKADVQRYELQLAAVRKIVSVFDDPGYNENDPQTQLKVVEMMTEMQSYGAPPQELMGDLPAAFGQEGGPPIPEGCIIA